MPLVPPTPIRPWAPLSACTLDPPPPLQHPPWPGPSPLLLTLPTWPLPTCNTATLHLLSSSPRGYPHQSPEPLKAAAKQLRTDGQLVVECEGMAAMPLFGEDGLFADVDWRDSAV